jgi:hypothetical protein
VPTRFLARFAADAVQYVSWADSTAIEREFLHGAMRMTSPRSPVAGAFEYIHREVSMGVLKKTRRKRVMDRPFPQAWLEILTRNFPRYARLSADDQRELLGHIQVFMAEKRFEGAQGLEMTDEIRVTIAAQACLLLLHRETDYYPGLYSIVVYPHEYVADRDAWDERGLVNRAVQVRLVAPLSYPGMPRAEGQPMSTIVTTSSSTNSPISSMPRRAHSTVRQSCRNDRCIWRGRVSWERSTRRFAIMSCDINRRIWIRTERPTRPSSSRWPPNASSSIPSR